MAKVIIYSRQEKKITSRVCEVNGCCRATDEIYSKKNKKKRNKATESTEGT